MRGKHRSTPMEDLVAQAKGLAKQGVSEIILIAQDLTYYGLDLYRERKLAELVRRLSDVEGIEWIRLHYAFPSGFPMDVLDVMAERSNVCNYLDMPLQHGTDEMLKAMRRGITEAKTDALIDAIRQRVPDIAIRTTLICGFPGETEAHFEHLQGWVERMRFDRLGCFTYSHEENTHAYTMNDDVPEEVKRARVEKIMDIQAGISEELNVARIGSVERVLIDRHEDGLWVGRTQYDSPDVDNEVRIAHDGHLRVGDFVTAKITGASSFDLDATLDRLILSMTTPFHVSRHGTIPDPSRGRGVDGPCCVVHSVGGCDVGCSWCDVKESWPVEAHPRVDVDTLVQEAVDSGLPRVVVTGGEPTMHDLGPLTEALKAEGLATHLETSGTGAVSGDWDWVTLSPKKFKPCLEEWYNAADELKVVVVNSHDLQWAEEHAEKLVPGTAKFLQPEWDRRDEVMERVLQRIQEAPQWRLSLQTHKFIGLP